MSVDDFDQYAYFDVQHKPYPMAISHGCRLQKQGKNGRFYGLNNAGIDRLYNRVRPEDRKHMDQGLQRCLDGRALRKRRPAGTGAKASKSKKGVPKRKTVSKKGTTASKKGRSKKGRRAAAAGRQKRDWELMRESQGLPKLKRLRPI